MRVSITLTFADDAPMLEAIDSLVGDEHLGSTRTSVVYELVREGLEERFDMKIAAPRKRRRGRRLRICEGTIRVAAPNVQCLACGAYGQRCDRTSDLAQVRR